MSEATHHDLQIDWIESPVGLLRLGASDSALHLLQFVDGAPVKPRARGGSPVLDQARRELAEYFAGTRRKFDVPLSFTGTPFQKRVWTTLCNIEYGERISYLEQSRRLGDELAIRA